MKILALTSDRLRHRALLTALAEVGHVTAFQEVAPRKDRSPIQARYFDRVAAAETDVFGEAPLPRLHARVVMAMGELSGSDHPLLNEDYHRVVTFGCSWIREPLVARLIAQRAINLHAGIAPQYRGTACNAWAEYHKAPVYVGATVHYLAPGIDSGDVIERVYTPLDARGDMHADPWMRGMLAVAEGIKAVRRAVWGSLLPVAIPQSELGRMQHYSRAADFTDEVAAELLERAGA